MSELTRESRYLIAKFRDIKSALSAAEVSLLNILMAKIEIGRQAQNKQPLTAVVIESDWPEYEKVWSMIEARMCPERNVKAGDYVSAKKLSDQDCCQGIYLCGDKSLFVILAKSGQTYTCSGIPTKIPDSQLLSETKCFVDLWRDQYQSLS